MTITITRTRLTSGRYSYQMSNSLLSVTRYGNTWKASQVFPPGENGRFRRAPIFLAESSSLKGCEEFLEKIFKAVIK